MLDYLYDLWEDSLDPASGLMLLIFGLLMLFCTTAFLFQKLSLVEAGIAESVTASADDVGTHDSVVVNLVNNTSLTVDYTVTGKITDRPTDPSLFYLELGSADSTYQSSAIVKVNAGVFSHFKLGDTISVPLGAENNPDFAKIIWD